MAVSVLLLARLFFPYTAKAEDIEPEQRYYISGQRVGISAENRNSNLELVVNDNDIERVDYETKDGLSLIISRSSRNEINHNSVIVKKTCNSIERPIRKKLWFNHYDKKIVNFLLYLPNVIYFQSKEDQTKEMLKKKSLSVGIGFKENYSYRKELGNDLTFSNILTLKTLFLSEIYNSKGTTDKECFFGVGLTQDLGLSGGFLDTTVGFQSMLEKRAGKYSFLLTHTFETQLHEIVDEDLPIRNILSLEIIKYRPNSQVLMHYSKNIGPTNWFIDTENLDKILLEVKNKNGFGFGVKRDLSPDMYGRKSTTFYAYWGHSNLSERVLNQTKTRNTQIIAPKKVDYDFDDLLQQQDFRQEYEKYKTLHNTNPDKEPHDYFFNLTEEQFKKIFDTPIEIAYAMQGIELQPTYSIRSIPFSNLFKSRKGNCMDKSNFVSELSNHNGIKNKRVLIRAPLTNHEINYIEFQGNKYLIDGSNLYQVPDLFTGITIYSPQWCVISIKDSNNDKIQRYIVNGSMQSLKNDLMD